jgi:hypothetical protein
MDRLGEEMKVWGLHKCADFVKLAPGCVRVIVTMTTAVVWEGQDLGLVRHLISASRILLSAYEHAPPL